MTKRQRKPETSTTVLAPRVACYLRTSTEDQAHQETIDAQRHFLRQYTALYQLDVIGEYADDGISGVLPFRQRPEGARLLQDAEAGKFGCVLAYNTKRLGRKLHVLLDLHATLSQGGVAIKSASEPLTRRARPACW
jgi:site-specific DNA recombinase